MAHQIRDGMVLETHLRESCENQNNCDCGVPDDVCILTIPISRVTAQNPESARQESEARPVGTAARVAREIRTDTPATAKRTSTLAGPSCNVLSTFSVECSNRMRIADRQVDDAGR